MRVIVKSKGQVTVALQMTHSYNHTFNKFIILLRRLREKYTTNTSRRFRDKIKSSTKCKVESQGDIDANRVAQDGNVDNMCDAHGVGKTKWIPNHSQRGYKQQ